MKAYFFFQNSKCGFKVEGLDYKLAKYGKCHFSIFYWDVLGFDRSHHLWEHGPFGKLHYHCLKGLGTLGTLGNHPLQSFLDFPKKNFQEKT